MEEGKRSVEHFDGVAPEGQEESPEKRRTRRAQPEKTAPTDHPFRSFSIPGHKKKNLKREVNRITGPVHAEHASDRQVAGHEKGAGA